jgi:hypothetical protein
MIMAMLLPTIKIQYSSHRGINVDHGINMDQHSQTRSNTEYCIRTCFVVLSVNLHEFHDLH